MTNAQIWAVIAAMFSLVGLMLAVVRWNLASLQKAMDMRFDAWIGAVDSRFNAVDSRFDAVDSRFDAMETRFDAVDRRFDAIDARFGYEREYNTVRFDAIEHRLDAVESDLSIIKGHLIGQRSA